MPDKQTHAKDVRGVLSQVDCVVVDKQLDSDSRKGWRVVWPAAELAGILKPSMDTRQDGPACHPSTTSLHPGLSCQVNNIKKLFNNRNRSALAILTLYEHETLKRSVGSLQKTPWA